MSRKSSPGRGSPPPRVQTRTYSNKRVPSRPAPPPPPPQKQKPPPPPQKQKPQQGSGGGRSLFKDMAATAGGVAVGSAVGHAVGAGITGMFSGGDRGTAGADGRGAVAAQEPVHGPCDLEIIRLLECAQVEDDLSMCQEMSDVFKRCLKKHGYV